VRYNPAAMLLYRRHLRTCRHRKKGQNFAGCQCPIWIDGFLKGRRYRKSLETCDWEKAERKKVGLEATGEDKACKKLADAIGDWDSSLVTQKLRESTLTKYRRLMKQLSGWCSEEGYLALSQITGEVLEAFRASRKHVSANTSLKELQCLRSFFAFCLSHEWCRSNPAKVVRPPKFKPNEVVPYTREQIAAMLSSCDQIGQQPYERLRAKALILIMRHTGLRISDALMLRRDRVRDGTIMLFTRKTGGHILLPIPQELELALEALPLPEPLAKDNGYYFWNGQATPKRLLESAERTLRSVFRKSGVKAARAHYFRHTLATELLAHGAGEQDVADVLGISPAIVRKHYGKWSQARQNRVFEMMRKYQRETIACPFCNGEGQSKGEVCKECSGLGRMALTEKKRD